MKVKLDTGATMPNRAHKEDAGLDLFAREDKIVPAGGSAVFDTGVHVQLPYNTAGLVVSKSGLNMKYDITSTGLVDEGYTGSIRVKLYNHSRNDYLVKAGDKISQLVVLEIAKPPVKEVDSLEETDRGDGGFGSTGK